MSVAAIKSAPKTTRSARFKWEKTTPGTHQYLEVDGDGQKTRELSGSIYVVKGVFGGEKPPMHITVTIEF